MDFKGIAFHMTGGKINFSRHGGRGGFVDHEAKSMLAASIVYQGGLYLQTLFHHYQSIFCGKSAMIEATEMNAGGNDL